MSVTVQNESKTTAEAVEVLMERLLASKVARLLASWQIGQGDYLKLREELFSSETVESLCQASQRERPEETTGGGNRCPHRRSRPYLSDCRRARRRG